MEDRFPWHRKVRGLTDAAFRLHVSGICWSTEHLTDGKIPTADLPLVSDVKKPAKVVEELEARGVWDVLPDGWEIHDYLTYNLTAEQVRAEREAAASRQKRARDRAKEQRDAEAKSQRESRPKSRRDSRRSNAEVTPDEAVPPTRPVVPTTSGAEAPAEESPGQRANRLTKTYTDLVPMSAFLAVQGVVAKAIKAAKTDAEIEGGLVRLAESGRPVTVNTLRIEIEGQPKTAAVGHSRVMPPGTHPHMAHLYEQS